MKLDMMKLVMMKLDMMKLDMKYYYTSIEKILTIRYNQDTSKIQSTSMIQSCFIHHVKYQEIPRVHRIISLFKTCKNLVHSPISHTMYIV